MSTSPRSKRLAVLAAAFIVGLTVTTAASARPGALSAGAATYNWQMQSLAPANNPNGLAWAYFAQQLDTLSQGQINLKVAFNAGLGLNPSQMVDLTSRHAVDIGEMVGAFVESALPEANLPSVPGLIPFNVATRQRVEAALAPEYAKLLAPKNIVYLNYCMAGPRSIMSKVPVRSAADLKGVKVSAGGGSAEAALTSALGGNPVTNLVTAELYPAIQTGVVDATWGPDTFFDTAKFYEISKYLYDVAVGGSTVLWGVNGDVWKSLSPALQKVVRKAASQAATKCYQLNQSAQSEGIADLKAHGVTVTEPNAADVKIISAATAPLAGSWAATHGPNAPRLLHIVQAVLGAKSVASTLSAKQAVPRPKGAARAAGSLTGVLTPTSIGGELEWSVKASGTTGPITSVELHSGTAGKAGPLLSKLCSGTCPTGVTRSKALGKGAYDLLYGGKPVYFVIATKKNPGGEARGTATLTKLSK